MLKSKRRCAVFTIVRNEASFLNIWYNYYRKHFLPDEIFILDHESSDGSTENYENVRKVQNDLTQDNRWLLEITQEFQQELLNKFEYVLFTNVDEIVCPTPQKYENVKDFLKNNGNDLFRCHGYEILNLPEEPPFQADLSVLNQRKHWYINNDLYSKSLLSRVPLKWTGGWHRVEGDFKTPIHQDLRLIHLHRMDFDLCANRHRKTRQEKIYQPDLKKKWGWHHLVTEEEFPKWFYSIITAKILYAEKSFEIFEKEKLKSLETIQQEAKLYSKEVESLWENVV